MFGAAPIPATCLAVAVAACSSPSVLTDARWNQASARPVDAACTVTVEDVGAVPWTGTRVYTADGKLVWGQNRLEYDSRSEEHVEYDAAGRVAEVTTRYEREFREGNCDVEGGCDEPAERYVARMRVSYDAAGRIIRAVTATTRYDQAREGERWVENDSDEDTVGFAYDDDGRLIERWRDDARARFHYKGDLLVGASFRSYLDSDPVIERDAAGRWARVDHGYAIHTFEYDAAGRVVRVVADGRSDGSDQDETWRYDDAGRVVYQDRGQLELAGVPRSSHGYTYDDRGLLVAWDSNGTPMVRYRYDGACDRVVVQPGLVPPQPMQVTFGGACASSPGDLVTVCAPEPR